MEKQNEYYEEARESYNRQGHNLTYGQFERDPNQH